MARTVMSSTDRLRRTAIRLAMLLACGAGLAGCIYPQEPLDVDFGRALHEDLVAQITNPEATYGPQPPADGARAGLAMERYQAGEVIKPQPLTASQVGGPASGYGPQR